MLRYYELFLELHDDISGVSDEDLVFYYVYYKNVKYDHKLCNREAKDTSDDDSNNEDIGKFFGNSGPVMKFDPTKEVELFPPMDYIDPELNKIN